MDVRKILKDIGTKMHYSNIKTCDISNGPGVRVSLFVSGCTRHCKGCFNEDTWSFNNGKEFDSNDMDDILSYASADYVDGLSILGGEPFEPSNTLTVDAIIGIFKYTYSDKSIWIWSGFTYEELVSRSKTEPYVYDILDKCDVLVDGPFEEDKKDLLLRFRGSTNQRIIDLNKSYCNGVFMIPHIEWHDDSIYEKRVW